MPNQQQLLTSIAAVAKQLGRAPFLLEFVTAAGIPKNSVFRLFPRWNDAVRAAGLQPHRLYLRPEDHELLTDWGETVRKLRAMPSRRAYDLNGRYYPVTLEKRFGGWAALPQAFRNFAKGQREWADVRALLGSDVAASLSRQLPAVPARGVVGARDTRARHTIVGARLPAAAGDNPPALSQRTGTRHTVVGARDTRARLTNDCSVSPIPPKQLHHPLLKERVTYGEPLNFPTLRHEPVNEQGVVLLFGMLAKDLGYVIESVQSGFPDCEAKRQIAPKRWQRVHIEFEFESRNFRDHGHPLTGCDIIVCWHHNWDDCPANIEVLELSTRIKSLPTPSG